jgi:hypothetical protein
MDGFLLKLAASGFGTAVALGCIWLVWKVIERYTRKHARDEGKEDDVPVDMAVRRPSYPGGGYSPAITPAHGVPVLPTPFDGVEDTGVKHIPPEKRPVVDEVCKMRQQVISQQIDALSGDVKRMDKRLADTGDKIDRASLKMGEHVSKLSEAVAVLKDRTARDRER